MDVTGHLTESIFDCYNIVSEADIQIATDKLAQDVATQPKERKVVTLAHSSHTISRTVPEKKRA